LRHGSQGVADDLANSDDRVGEAEERVDDRFALFVAAL
jgi:hypothetical protein